MMPDFAIETEHGGRVAGVDEVGRGPLAGPVVAAAVMFPAGIPAGLAALLDDSKKLSVGARLLAFEALKVCDVVEVGVGAASVSEISHLNILQASLLAMRRAVSQLPTLPDMALIDGNRAPTLACPARCVVGGDAISLSIAAASIVAKVIRDRAMVRLGVRFPHYGWETNSGYGTAHHRAAIHTHGPTRHHRPGFGTVRLCLAAGNAASGQGALTRPPVLRQIACLS